MEYKGDKVYIGQVLEGNINAFSFIVDRHKDRAFNLAYRICGSREDAEEIAQDAFMKAFRSLGSFKLKCEFSTWLYRIVYNTAVSHVRSMKKDVVSLEDFPPDAFDFTRADPDEDDEKEYRKELLGLAMKTISVEDRGLISLFYFDEMNIDEIASVTRLTRSNIKVRLFRARQKITEEIGKRLKRKMIVQ
jgi:RNA polymerase sigma-70 factor (ECF subfamily)